MPRGICGGGRTWLEERGLALSLDYYGEAFWNTRGGERTTDSPEYEGLLELAVEFSTKSAGLWKGGNLFFLFRNKHGHGISEEYVGGAQPLSKIEAPTFTHVAELWYVQSFLDGRIRIKVGKQDANEIFAGVDYGEEFLNSSADYSPTIPLASYPDPDMGIALGTDPVPWFSFDLGVYTGDPNANRSLKGAFVELSGPMVIGEPALHYGLCGRPGNLRAGGWFNGTEAGSPGEDDSETFGEAYGWYLTWDQELWTERPQDPEDTQGIGLFGQYGWAPPDRSAVEHYLGGGVRWEGLVPSRARDVLGLGVFHVRFSEKAGVEKDTETVVEAFYLLQFMGCLFVQPDLQYIINPGGTTNPDALAVGLRFGVSL
jgi:porin